MSIFDDVLNAVGVKGEIETLLTDWAKKNWWLIALPFCAVVVVTALVTRYIIKKK